MPFFTLGIAVNDIVSAVPEQNVFRFKKVAHRAMGLRRSLPGTALKMGWRSARRCKGPRLVKEPARPPGPQPSKERCRLGVSYAADVFPSWLHAPRSP
ncbi:hypothetical protein [Stigmatella erecta]|uniref:hypothetical protein n=1 Tax=Stigmatella erecta TaxID=83460 RepID=UPI001FE99B4D|nr:hypothetical protein [Stigmatella erecta]